MLPEKPRMEIHGAQFRVMLVEMEKSRVLGNISEIKSRRLDEGLDIEYKSMKSVKNNFREDIQKCSLIYTKICEL